MRKTYPERKNLRRGESLWSRLEGAVDGLTTPTYNPLYHLGTLTIFLFLVLAVTGIYLTIFYRPGADRAYETVAWMSSTFIGSLMRSVHRYASDALMVTILLHALKMFLSDRFWGSRWFAWITGIVLVSLVWVIGGMGYWLIWDQQSQWMTEYGINLVKGPVASTFLGLEIVSRTYAFFVIILFLHVFLGILIILGVLLHVIRLSRAKFWSPKWVMIEAGIVLIAIALWKPVSSGLPADLSRMVGTFVLDDWYLGFLRLIYRIGNAPFWLLAALVAGVIIAIPWLLRGKHAGPAIVTDSFCTGCALCANECPYNAIDMVTREDDSGYKLLAEINPDLCVGCGICIGTCATLGVELQGMPADRLKETLWGSIIKVCSAGISPVVTVTCQRQAALGTLNDLKVGVLSGENGYIPASHDQFPALKFPKVDIDTPRFLSSPVIAGYFVGGNPHPSVPVVTCTLPCVGMMPPDWVSALKSGGARDVVVLSCPSDDCASREGPHWLGERMRRFRLLEQDHFHWQQLAPGNKNIVAPLFKALSDPAGVESPTLPELIRKPPIRIPAIMTGLLVLAVAFVLSLVAQHPVTASPPDQGKVRLIMVHQGVLKAGTDLSAGLQSTLPPGVSPEQIFGGERYPVRLKMQVGDQVILDEVYEPGGLRNEDAIYVFESWMLDPGIYGIQIWLDDSEVDLKLVYSEQVALKAGHVQTISFDRDRKEFVAYKK